MKLKFWLAVISAAMVTLATARAQTTQEPTAPDNIPAPTVSSAVADVIKMAEAGTSEDVLLAYVQDSSSSFDLSADQILYLRDIGLSSNVISAMLNRDAALKGQTAEQTYAQPAAPPTAPAEAPTPEAPASTVAQAPPPVYVGNPPQVVSYFYDDLAPYGTWIQLDSVGWCWQPRVVVFNHSWRPYCDSGHWIYTDAGWFWQSDYSWGWAPFHYGRWLLQEGYGWVWAPDRVWGPAWVTWRYEGDHCGWAPLPPHADFDLRLGYCFNGVHVGFDFDFGLRPEHFTFISLHDFDDRDYSRDCLAPAQVTRIFNHTTVINNYVVNNNKIVNRGIRVESVAAATHTEIHQLPIHDVPSWSPGPGGRARSEVAVYRPQFRPVARPVNMVAQRIEGRHSTIQPLRLGSPALARPLSRPTLWSLADHRYATVGPRHEKPQWAPKPSAPEHVASAQNSGNDTSDRSYSAFVGRAVQKTVPAMKAANGPGQRAIPEVTRWSRVPANGSYNSPRLQAPLKTSGHFAGEPNQRLHSSTQDRRIPQDWLAQQPTHVAAAHSHSFPSRQTPLQLPRASQARPNAQSLWSGRQAAPSYRGLSAGANQVRRSIPVTQARPQNTYKSPGANRPRFASQRSPHMAQFHAQSGAQPSWRAQSYASSHRFEPAYTRSYKQPRGQFSANSHPPGVTAPPRGNPHWQGDPGANSRGDAYKHHNQ